ncbi:SiaB family protein kinase [Methanospirillum stamsii]|uniref:Uncharacterized protein n=1 Tax=Methanospirillum stamsii TaxID=1277351 RepID=A0A2V2NIX2_9EURY|nr:SiaB family protein kinase [Methanospirillum stamsii]PWR75561.1 hypothetical protein DLD82_04130 [Methanospirillum stamsii]
MCDLLQLKEIFNRKGVLISFNGSLTNSIIEEIGNAIRQYLVDNKHGKGTISDVFAVYIEQTQNVRNYLKISGLEEKYWSTILVISNKDGNYQVSSGNSIRKQDVPTLLARLEQINNLDQAGLKKLYKEQLRKERNPVSLGAGLGLIEIARHAKEKLDYQFDEIDENCDFFSLIVTIQGEPDA